MSTETNMPEVPASSRRFGVSLRFVIFTVFLVIVAGTAGTLIVAGHMRSSAAALVAADRLLLEVSDKVFERTRGIFSSLRAVGELGEELPGLSRKPTFMGHPATRFLMETIRVFPHIWALYLGWEDGDYFMVANLGRTGDEDDDGHLHAALGAPPEARFAIRAIIAQSGGRRLEAWRFVDDSGGIVGSQTNRGSGFDPRWQPWYRAAVGRQDPVKTDLYVLPDLNEPGIAVSRRFDGRVSGVMGLDMRMDNLSRFLAGQKISASATLFLFKGDGRITAHPTSGRLIQRIAATNNFELATVETIGDPVIKATFERFHADSDAVGRELLFEVAGTRYIARISAMPSDFGSDEFLAVAVPVEEFLAPIYRMRTEGLLVSAGIFLLVIPMVVWLSTRLATPIRALAVQAEQLRLFRLDSPAVLDSHVGEIRELSEAVATAKTAFNTFSRYVPRTMVMQLIQSGIEPELGGSRQEVTLMFTDVADFAAIAEEMDPERLMLHISNYLETLGGNILAHEGTIDKFIGDSIMAMWNAPAPVEDHARKACIAAFACRSLSRAMETECRRNKTPPMRTRFGLHTGEAIVGNIGSSDRMDYTAIGVTVNLASRLEGLNKYYGTEILISEATHERLRGDFVTRPVDLVLPKGMRTPVVIHELLGARPDADWVSDDNKVTTEQISYCRMWEEAYEHYRARDWDAATAYFLACARRDKKDLLAKIYVERASHCRDQPPPEDWLGVEEYLTK